jgi:hypothetical protein
MEIVRMEVKIGVQSVVRYETLDRLPRSGLVQHTLRDMNEALIPTTYAMPVPADPMTDLGSQIGGSRVRLADAIAVARDAEWLHA